MKASIRSISVFVLGAILIAQVRGFGTGSHFDLTHAVLAEHGFNDTPVKIVQVENWLTDYYTNSPTYGDKRKAVLAKLHFDNLFNEDQVRAYWATLLRNLKSATERAASDNDQPSMLVILGIGLHAVQDFYSHSNWAELHPVRDKDEFRAETYLGAMRSPNASVKGLHTGKYPDDRISGPGPFPVPIDASLHGGYRDGLNKDSASRPHWDEAYVFAYAGSHELVLTMEMWAEKVRPGFWRSVREYAVSANQEKRLDLDIVAARNMSMWLEGKGQDGTWKGEGSGSTRFFADFSSEWLVKESSIFVTAIREGGIQEDIAADLYTRAAVSELPAVKPFALDRNTLVINITYVAERKEGKSFGRRFSVGGPDLYSRILAGGQEFWGRTIQKSREAVDPWYEIFMADRNMTEIPVVISIWDEDHIDSAKDMHIDINPAAGVLDVKMVFHTSDGSVSGDVNGIFDSRDKTFTSEGQKPDERRAIIRGFVAQRLIR